MHVGKLSSKWICQTPSSHCWLITATMLWCFLNSAHFPPFVPPSQLCLKLTAVECGAPHLMPAWPNAKACKQLMLMIYISESVQGQTGASRILDSFLSRVTSSTLRTLWLNGNGYEWEFRVVVYSVQDGNLALLVSLILLKSLVCRDFVRYIFPTLPLLKFETLTLQNLWDWNWKLHSQVFSMVW